MRKKVYKSDPKALLEEGRALLSKEDDLTFGHRITVVNMVLSGMDVSIVAANIGLDVRSVQRWVKSVDDVGSFEVLRPKHPTGQPRRLSEVQLRDLYQVVRHESKDYGYNNWDGKTVSSYIYSTYGVELKVRACQKLLHDLGMTLLRAQPHPNHQPDQDPREEFKKN